MPKTLLTCVIVITNKVLFGLDNNAFKELDVNLLLLAVINTVWLRPLEYYLLVTVEWLLIQEIGHRSFVLCTLRSTKS